MTNNGDQQSVINNSRFSSLHTDAFNGMNEGSIGCPSIFRSYTLEYSTRLTLFIEYAEFSGGELVSCNIRDVDITLCSSWPRFNR